jgi:hypothetical protein
MVVVALGVVGQAAHSSSGPANGSTSGPQDSSASATSNGSPGRRLALGSDHGRLARGVTIVDPVVNNTNPNLGATDTTGGWEPSIAVNPQNPNDVVMTSFSGSWLSGPAPLWFSSDGGMTWTKEASIAQPSGLPRVGCPCDQTVDYGRDGTLYGAFLTSVDNFATFNVVSGSTNDPTSATAWRWNGNPAQFTDQQIPRDADQPWLTVSPDPSQPNTSDEVHVGYDYGLDTAPAPRAQVATAAAVSPPNFQLDTSPGNEFPLDTNPGLRLAADRRTGTLYALYQRSTGFPGQPRTVSYILNRSLDGGQTWSLNGSADGITIDTVPSDQAPLYKFGTVNALLGGVDHLAVDPRAGDVFVVYGADLASTGIGNQLYLRKLSPDAQGNLAIGPPRIVTTAASAALPSVAVTDNGTVGVLYDTFDGSTADGFPIFSAHLARSPNDGKMFKDTVLEQFTSPVTDNGDIRQRILGDYQQLKALGDTFYGTFSGNRAPFGAPISIIDPIYFSATG